MFDTFEKIIIQKKYYNVFASTGLGFNRDLEGEYLLEN